MKYKWIYRYLVSALVLASLSASSAAGPKGAPPAKMMGAAPVPKLLGPPPPKQAAQGQEPGAVKPIASTLPSPITPEDYTLYLKKGQKSPEWDEWIKPGFESFDEGNYATAGIFFKNAYEKGCRDPMVLFRLGLYRESRGEIKEAAQMLAEAAKGVTERYPEHPLAKAIHRHAARALYKSDQFKQALPELMKALEYEPTDFMLLIMAGQVERMEGRKKEARALFERALAAPKPEGMTPDPKLTVLGELIIITYDLKDYEACEKYVTQAAEIDPKGKVATKYRGMIQKEKYRKKELEIIKKITE